MRCPSCEFDSPEGKKFCGKCGAPLPRRCSNCGEENPPQFKFCGECGATLDERQKAKGGIAPQSPTPHPQSPITYTPCAFSRAHPGRDSH
jgi:hypothetical protein